jgi:uncharacterized membrane protein YtjA (UPF0391 family)
MLRWTITFLVVTLFAALFAFAVPSSQDAKDIAGIIFYIFLVFLVISLIAGSFRRTD